jgi:hypothetical protein
LRETLDAVWFGCRLGGAADSVAGIAGMARAFVSDSNGRRCLGSGWGVE